MKNLKYRAYIKSTGIVVPVSLINFVNDLVEVILPKDRIATYRLDEVVIMRGFGLLDKHGKEISEKHIVQYTITNFTNCGEM